MKCVALCIAVQLLAASAMAAEPAAAPAPAPVTAPATAPARVAASQPPSDRLELEASAITGNRELPKVMSIVPWKAAEPPAGPDRPMGSLIEELLVPVDRAEFRREVEYYRELMTPDTAASPVASPPTTSSPNRSPSPSPAHGALP